MNMNERTKIYCQGAAMAYRDVADKLENMAKKAPDEIKEIVSIFIPFAESCRKKADNVFIEAEKFVDFLNIETDGNA